MQSHSRRRYASVSSNDIPCRCALPAVPSFRALALRRRASWWPGAREPLLLRPRSCLSRAAAAASQGLTH
eukprot:6205994-Prymnesium_polylepis.1